MASSLWECLSVPRDVDNAVLLEYTGITSFQQQRLMCETVPFTHSCKLTEIHVDRKQNASLVANVLEDK